MNLKDGRRIIPNHNPYNFAWGCGAPEKIGDTALIEIDKPRFESIASTRTHRGHLQFKSATRVKVILLEAEDGSLWLVEHPDSAQLAVCRYTRTPGKPFYYTTARAGSGRR